MLGLRLAALLAATGPCTAPHPQIQNDLHVGSAPVGIVTRVASNGTLFMRRTNNGATGGTMKLRLFGIVFPKDRKNREKALHYLRETLSHLEIRAAIERISKDLYFAYIAPTAEGKLPTNSYLIYVGLADTDHPEVTLLRSAREHAKKNKLGIWAQSR